MILIFYPIQIKSYKYHIKYADKISSIIQSQSFIKKFLYKKQKIYNKKKVQKMQQLKQIILSRINDIKQLQILQSESNINSKNRYHTILMQRYGEQSRNSRQTEILALCIRQPEILNPQELFGFAKYICALYDPYLESKQQGDIKNRLYLLLRSFFSKHDLHQKLPTLKSIFGKNTNKIYVYPVLHLLSQWSKKRYLKILSIQIKSMKKQNPYQTLDSQSPSHTQCQKSNQCSPIQSQNKIINRINSMRSDIATNQRQDKKKKQNESSINSGKILTIYNKTTLYSYFSIQLDQYYNLTGIQNLDIFYIKTLCKRKMKDHLLLPQNINRAVNILIDSSNNKEIKNHVNNWMIKNQQYKQSDRYKTKLLKCDTKNLITPIDQQEVDDKKYKKLSLDIKSQETHEIPKIERSVQLSRKKIKDNSILLERTKEQVYESMRDIAQKSSISKIRYHKKLEQLKVEDNQENITSQNHHQNNKNKLKLPSLSRSMQKQSNQDDNKKIIRFSTQEQEILQDQPKHEEKQLPRFKFIQRQTIKGIIIKNFLSNRQKNKKNHIKKIQCKSARKQSEEILNNLEQKKKNVESQPRKITDCVDIRSLRQKTRALLRNFNTIQNYLS